MTEDSHDFVGVAIGSSKHYALCVDRNAKQELGINYGSHHAVADHMLLIKNQIFKNFESNVINHFLFSHLHNFCTKFCEY